MELDRWKVFSLLSPALRQKVRLACVFGKLLTKLHCTDILQVLLTLISSSGNHGNEALLVTVDDEVYALGSNAHGCLGLGNQQGTLFPQCVEQLCGKGIKSNYFLFLFFILLILFHCSHFFYHCLGFTYGSGPHVLALTERGEVYSWGQNVYCELGHGASTPGLMPTMIGGFLSTLVVSEVACGSHHSIALTECGQVKQDHFCVCCYSQLIIDDR